MDTGVEFQAAFRRRSESSRFSARLARVSLAVVGLVLKLAVIVTLPFALLIRGSVHLYEALDWPTWVALGGGFALTMVLLVAYLAAAQLVLLGAERMTVRSLRNQALVVVAVLLAYGVLTQVYLAGSHAKSAAIRSEYRSLHPLLRLGVSTIILVDSGLLVTDMARTKDDYQRMGIPTRARSLHFVQADGYVHAIDLRTNDRGRVRNWLLEAYFGLAGFETLRHVGTADHLHVSLAMP